MAEEARDRTNRILTIPNLLSAFRILLVPVIVWLYCWKADYPLAAWTLTLSGLTDIVDGFIARRFHMVSNLGKALDPIADKLTQTAALGCLLTRFGAMWWLLGVLVAKETIMAFMGLLVIRRTGAAYSAVSYALTAAGVASMLLSLSLYTAANLRRIKTGRQ